MIHLPPDPHVLASLANANMPWWKALAEFVDNSLDAGATRVVIDVTNRVLTISDDGLGCEDVTALFKLGDHKRRRSAKKKGIGRYGIGAKDAWLSCADTMEVETYCDQLCTKMRVNYEEWMQSNWNVADPEISKSDLPSGTFIRLPLRSGKNSPTNDVFKTLGFVFTPAISRGTQIVNSVNGKRRVLAPVEMPLRNDVVQAEFEVDGKTVQIDVGILPDGITIEQGPFWVIYDHRIIDATSIGVGPYSARRIAGTITLGDGWDLTKNKDCLSEKNQDRLGDAVFVRIEHILKKADMMAETIASAALRHELQSILNTAVADANKKKEKRGKGDATGGVQPTGSGRKRLRAKKTQPGPGPIFDPDSKPLTRSGYNFDWCDMDSSDIGKFDRTGMRVSLNVNNQFIAHVKSNGNKEALVACCVALIADYCTKHDTKGNTLLRFSYKNFADAMGLIVQDFGGSNKDAKAAI